MTRREELVALMEAVQKRITRVSGDLHISSSAISELSELVSAYDAYQQEYEPLIAHQDE